MELASIEKLVEKYENAETTLQEEATLKAYFLSDNFAPNLKKKQMMFTYFQISKDETYTKTIELKTKKKRNFKWLSVAASVVLLFSVYLGNEKMNEIQERKQAEQTLAEVMNALKMLSGNLKKGNEAFNNLYAYEDSVNKIFKTK